jgi:hypothetical protein
LNTAIGNIAAGGTFCVSAFKLVLSGAGTTTSVACDIKVNFVSRFVHEMMRCNESIPMDSNNIESISMDSQINIESISMDSQIRQGHHVTFSPGTSKLLSVPTGEAGCTPSPPSPELARFF